MHERVAPYLLGNAERRTTDESDTHVIGGVLDDTASAADGAVTGVAPEAGSIGGSTDQRWRADPSDGRGAATR